MPSILLNAADLCRLAGVSRGHSVAEFAPSRSGHLTFELARSVGERGRVYAVDILPSVVEMLDSDRANRCLHHLSCVQGDFERPGSLPITEDSLDHIFLVGSLWRVRSLSGLIEEARRLLSPDGRLVIVDWRSNTNHPIGPQAAHRTAPEDVARAFSTHGFTPQAQLPLPDPYWGLTFTPSTRY